MEPPTIMSIRQSAPGSYPPPQGHQGYQGQPGYRGQPGQGYPPAGPPPAPPGDRPSAGNRRWFIITLAVVVVLGLVAVVAGVMRFLSDDTAPATTAPPGNSAPRVVTGPIGDLNEAVFDVVNGASALTLKAADLGTDLYRVETPAGGALVPHVENNSGNVQLHLVPSGDTGPGSVEVQLNAKLAWTLKLTGSVGEEKIDLSGTTVKKVDVMGGGQLIELTLPKPTGVLTVTMTGGAGQFIVHAPRDVPAKLTLGNGAGTVNVDGKEQKSVKGGTTISPPGWDAAKDKIDVNATAGASVLTIDRG